MKKQEFKGIVKHFGCEFFAILHTSTLSFVFVYFKSSPLFQSNHTVGVTPPEIICVYIFLYTRYLKMFQMEVVNVREIGILCYAYVCPPFCIQCPYSKKNDEARCEGHVI
jgi:hypothetical protein